MNFLELLRNWLAKRKQKLTNYERGKLAEREAAFYLRRRGYQIITQNLKLKQGEIDLVALKGNLVIFVEVKARSSEEFGTPIESLLPKQQQRIRRAAEAFLAKRGWSERDRRFDLIAIDLDERGYVKQIEHIPNAF
ncbi:MAG: YraN family protein [Armatimonadetes bacterium]|nr:YraN family protein [Armatimonadota bacterium]MDW8029247.1 YraN family protein [Armatimonadota bacterium]